MKILQDKQSVRKYREFYETPDEYDVLYFGSSHMMQTALPMEIWKKYGIRSYNMGNGTENIAVSYQVIKNTLDYCSPRVMYIIHLMTRLLMNSRKICFIFFSTW